MHKEILENIYNLDISKESKVILIENCLKHIFSWNPFEVKKSEYFKRFFDWIKIKNNYRKYCDIANYNFEKEFLSEYFKNEIKKCIHSQVIRLKYWKANSQMTI